MTALLPQQVSDPFSTLGHESPGFAVKVFNKASVFKGWLAGYESLTVTVRRNAIGSAELVVRANHPRIPDLLASGCRLSIRYDNDVLMTGRIEVREGKRSDTPTMTFTVVDDFQYFSTILGWQNPAVPIGSQSPTPLFDTFTGTPRAILGHFVTPNAARLGLPITVATTDIGTGTPKVRMRMNPLADKLFPLLDYGDPGSPNTGLRVTVQHDEASGDLEVDAYIPEVRDRVLSEEAGVLVDWSWTKTDPTYTRVVVMAGEQGARVFRTVTLTTRETELGTVKEGFLDASSDAEGATMTADMDRLGLLFLLENDAEYGISLTLAENAGFRYGKTFKVGDTLTVDVIPGVSITDICREVTITHNVDQGVVIDPTVGALDSTVPQRNIINTISALIKRLRKLETER